MSELRVTGTVKQVFQTETKGNFTFRLLWLTTDPASQYPQTIEIQFAQAKTSLLDGVNAGDEISVDFNLRGRSWLSPQQEEKVFNTVQGWRVTKGASVQQPAGTQSGTFDPSNPTNDPKDNLPF